MYNQMGSIGWLETVDSHSEMEIVFGDIRDRDICKTHSRGVDVVINFAALIGIPYSYQAPESYIQTNIFGTANIARAVLENDISHSIFLSTSEVYGSSQYSPMDESHPLSGQSPYSASKIGADALVRSFHDSFGLPATIVRPFNAYGPRQSSRAFIPSVISQILQGAKTVNVGDLSTTRDLTFVADTCKSILDLVYSSPKNAMPVNIGTGSETSMATVLSMVQEILGTKVAIKEQDERKRPEKSEVRRLICDNNLLASITGDTPSTDLMEGLEKTINWFKKDKNLEKYRDSSTYAI